MAAPLTGRDGSTLGPIYLSDRVKFEFSADDEAILVQLAQMGSIALENTIYAQERHVNRIKDEFLVTLSHELRTPLNAILGWTQLLRLEHKDGETAHGLEVIERNARAQTKLIEDLLDVSRIATGKMQLKLGRSTLGPIVGAAVDTARPAAESGHIALSVDLTAADVPVMIDPDRVQQVVWNLFSNALKFTPAGGAVAITLRQPPERRDVIRLEIQDSGQGIDPKFLPYVFDRFRQADSTSTRSHGGLGIGLAIVRHVIEQHGGNVSAHSEGVGRGATFTIELPIGSTETVAPAAPNILPAHNKAVAHNGHDHASVAGLRILVVDDEADARELIASTLRHAGATVSIADSVAQALEQLEEFKPDILLSDIAMPDQDGYMLVRQIRQHTEEDYRNIPAIAITAYARGRPRQCLIGGFSGTSGQAPRLGGNAGTRRPPRGGDGCLGVTGF